MDTATLNNPSGHKAEDTMAADRRLRIYVCSPYRSRMESAELAKRELADNIDRAKTACRLVADMGAVPICSHLFCTQFLDDSIASEREQESASVLRCSKTRTNSGAFRNISLKG